MNDQTVLKNGLHKLDASAGRLERRQDARNEENERLAAVVSAGLAPNECGPEMVSIAPARGRVIPFRNAETYLNTDGDVETIDHGAHGRLAMRRGDVFDLMIDQAAKRKKVLGLTTTQIQMGRVYRDLVERHASAGIRCSSVEGLPGGGGSGGGFMDAVLDQGSQIDYWRSLIGDGLAMDIRRVRPSKRGERIAIKAQRLVDMVCLEDKSISHVLYVHGWSNRGDSITKLTIALGECLERMAGPVRAQRTQSATFGAQDMADSGFEQVRHKNGEIVAGRYQGIPSDTLGKTKGVDA